MKERRELTRQFLDLLRSELGGEPAGSVRVVVDHRILRLLLTKDHDKKHKEDLDTANAKP